VATRSDEDLRLWYKWDANGRKSNDLEPLLNRFDGAVNYTINKYKTKGGISGNIPEPALKAEVQNNLIDAFESYDPSKNVKLNTYATHHLKKTHRYFVTHQNTARIPEPYANRIGQYQTTYSHMQEALRRPPSVHELADELKWPVSHVETMQKSLRQDLSSHMFQVDPISLQTSRWGEVKALVPYELSSQEKAVFELLMKEGKPVSKTEIARKLNISPSRVSKINKKIADKIQRYMYA